MNHSERFLSGGQGHTQTYRGDYTAKYIQPAATSQILCKTMKKHVPSHQAYREYIKVQQAASTYVAFSSTLLSAPLKHLRHQQIRQQYNFNLKVGI